MADAHFDRSHHGRDRRRSRWLFGLHQKMGAPVLGPARFVVCPARRTLLAITDDRDAVRPDTSGYEVVRGSLRAPLAQRHVVLVRAALVAVAFDQQEMALVLCEPYRVGVQDLCIRRTDFILVEVEMNVVEIWHRREFLGCRPRRRSAGVARGPWPCGGGRSGLSSRGDTFGAATRGRHRHLGRGWTPRARAQQENQQRCMNDQYSSHGSLPSFTSMAHAELQAGATLALALELVGRRSSCGPAAHSFILPMPAGSPGELVSDFK